MYMRLTRAAEYAIRCLLYLSSKNGGAVVSRREIASAMEIPDPFMSKIAQQLARAGFIQIIQGVCGGYRLLVSAEKLNLLEVVETMIGEIYLSDCLMSPNPCVRNQACAVNRVWEKARTQIRNTLREATFAKLLREETCFSPLLTFKDLKRKRKTSKSSL
jgi:Rrf2 family protein